NGSEQERDQATNILLEAGGARAMRGVQARGHGLPPVWTKAYTGLAGLYLQDRDAAIPAAFEEALGGGTIGERIGKPVLRDQQLAGDIWFYYGSRYGEYRGTTHQGDAEDYLPAAVEVAPGRAAAYTDLADYYAENGVPAAALADYQRSLELNAVQPSVEDRVAIILWKQGDHDQALARWKAALQALAAEQDRHINENFWSDFDTIVQHSGSRGLLAQLRTPLDSLLRTYIRRNGS